MTYLGWLKPLTLRDTSYQVAPSQTSVKVALAAAEKFPTSLRLLPLVTVSALSKTRVTTLPFQPVGAMPPISCLPVTVTTRAWGGMVRNCAEAIAA